MKLITSLLSASEMLNIIPNGSRLAHNLSVILMYISSGARVAGPASAVLL